MTNARILRGLRRVDFIGLMLLVIGRLAGWLDIFGWVDGWMDGWMSGWMDGWMDGWMNE